MRLHDRVALVTGSSSGVGAAVARAFAAEGADVIVNFRTNEAGAEATAEAVRAAGRRAVVVQADVGAPLDVEKLFGAIRDRFGRLDILVNNAGVTLKKPFAQSDVADWDRVHAANLRSVFLCSREALTLMPKGGVMLNISSAHAASTTRNFSIYAASKAGMEALTRSLAIELGDRNIRVNALRLGWIQVARDRIDRDDPAYDAVCQRIPLGRPGEVEDVGPVAVHLCSDEARYMTGQVVVLDGGHGACLNTAFAKGHVRGGATD